MMRRFVGALAVATATVFAAPAAYAQSGPCDSYSGACVNPGRDTVKTPTKVKGVKSTLPFTGGELVLLTVVGAGVVATGTVLVASSRRRSRPAA